MIAEIDTRRDERVRWPTSTIARHGPLDSDGQHPTLAAGLTPRECDVLALLRWRLTDAEIAAHLGISPRTVSTHVGNILSKLEVGNRREASALAARHGAP